MTSLNFDTKSLFNVSPVRMGTFPLLNKPACTVDMSCVLFAFFVSSSVLHHTNFAFLWGISLTALTAHWHLELKTLQAVTYFRTKTLLHSYREHADRILHLWTLRNNKVRTADKQFHGQMMFYSLVTLDVLWDVEPALVAVHYKSQCEVTGAAVEEAVLGWRVK